MVVLSLFDGISTGRLALEMAGISVSEYMASEIDPSPMRISAARWPEIVQVGDIKNLRARKLPKIDLLIGGSPCQGFSRAGGHLNFDDPRSSLFFEYVRILNEARKENPHILFMLENVDMKKEWEQVITESLYIQPIHINSKLVSAQNRPRTYWTNIPNVSIPQDKHITLANTIRRKIDTSGYIAERGILFDPSIPPNGRALAANEGGLVRVRQATKQGYIVANDGDGVNLAFPTSKTRRGRVTREKSGTLDCSCEVCVLHDGMIRHFTIEELEALQTLPNGYTAVEGLSTTDRKKAIGNGWTAAVIAGIFENLK